MLSIDAIRFDQYGKVKSVPAFGPTGSTETILAHSIIESNFSLISLDRNNPCIKADRELDFASDRDKIFDTPDLNQLGQFSVI